MDAKKTSPRTKTKAEMKQLARDGDLADYSPPPGDRPKHFDEFPDLKGTERQWLPIARDISQGTEAMGTEAMEPMDEDTHPSTPAINIPLPDNMAPVDQRQHHSGASGASGATIDWSAHGDDGNAHDVLEVLGNMDISTASNRADEAEAEEDFRMTLDSSLAGRQELRTGGEDILEDLMASSPGIFTPKPLCARTPTKKLPLLPPRTPAPSTTLNSSNPWSKASFGTGTPKATEGEKGRNDNEEIKGASSNTPALLNVTFDIIFEK